MNHSLSCLFPVFSSFQGRVAVASFNHNQNTLLIPGGDLLAFLFFFLNTTNVIQKEKLGVCFNCV